MERGVDDGGGARLWRWRGDWVTALEAARVCIWNLDLERNGLDFIECEIVRV